MALQAEKLVFLTEEAGIRRADGSLANTLSVGEVQELIHDNPDAPADLLHAAVGALENGVSRVQILNGREDGSLLRELFTREGSGTSVFGKPYFQLFCIGTRSKHLRLRGVENLFRTGLRRIGLSGGVARSTRWRLRRIAVGTSVSESTRLKYQNAFRLIHTYRRMVCRTGLSDGLSR